MLLSKQLFFIHTTWNWKEIIWESGKKNKKLCWLNRLNKPTFHLHKKKNSDWKVFPASLWPFHMFNIE